MLHRGTLASSRHQTEENVRVFVSSTYRDLVTHRELLRLAIESSGYQFCGMEYFVADGRAPLDVALDALNGCDVYVLIIGDSYGSSPPARARSFTELEYLRAQELGLPTIALVLAPDAQVNRAQIDYDPKKRERLARFQAGIQKRHTVQFFKEPNELAWRILAALRVYEARLREAAAGAVENA